MAAVVREIERKYDPAAGGTHTLDAVKPMTGTAGIAAVSQQGAQNSATPGQGESSGAGEANSGRGTPVTRPALTVVSSRVPRELLLARQAAGLGALALLTRRTGCWTEHWPRAARWMPSAFTSLDRKPASRRSPS